MKGREPEFRTQATKHGPSCLPFLREQQAPRDQVDRAFQADTPRLIPAGALASAWTDLSGTKRTTGPVGVEMDEGGGSAFSLSFPAGNPAVLIPDP